MEIINIVNPIAGHKEAEKYASRDTISKTYITQGIGDAKKFAYETCMDNPDKHFVIYGGDGTISEVVNGIMAAGTQDKTVISVIPVGTGNDLFRNFKEEKKVHLLDVLKYNDKYAINEINIGLDCSVVEKQNDYKKYPIFKGSSAYIGGLVYSALRKYGLDLEIEITTADDEQITFSGTRLLCLIANCAYYGGGFKSSPTSKYDDGLMDFIMFDKLPRYKFITLVGDYKNGKHIDPETDLPVERFEKYLHHYKCKKIKVSGMNQICVDGELENTNEIEVSIIEKQIRLMI